MSIPGPPVIFITDAASPVMVSTPVVPVIVIASVVVKAATFRVTAPIAFVSPERSKVVIPVSVTKSA